MRDKIAGSRVVHLSIKEKISVAEETCRYYMRRQAFPVKLANKVPARMDVEEWLITLAFPLEKRLTRGTPCVGVFAFLPTAMVINFPFAIQADFILASSRESIQLDNKWNTGILECIPSAFTNAIDSCLKKTFPRFSVCLAFKLLPAKLSPFPKLNKARKSIRGLFRDSRVVPSSNLHGEVLFFQPSHVITTLLEFRELLVKLKGQKIPLTGLHSLDKFVLHPSLDIDKYSAVQNFLGVAFTDESSEWYARCIKACNLALLALEDLCIDLLSFIAYRKIHSLEHTPLLKYINHEGNVHMCSLAKATRKEWKVCYAPEPDLHNWLNKCNIEFGFPNHMFFLPDSTQQALVDENRFSFLEGMQHARVEWLELLVLSWPK